MELDDFTSVLSQSDFFGICSEEQRRLLAFASERRDFEPGQYLFKKGDPSLGAFVLMNGRVLAGEGQAMHKLTPIGEPGTVLGELGLVLERPRRASMRASGAVTVLFVPRSAFVKLMRQYPAMAERAAARISAELGDFLGAMDNFVNRPPGP